MQTILALDRRRDGEMPRHVTEPAAPVYHSRRGCLRDDPRPRVHAHATVTAQHIVARDHRNAVAIDAVQVRPRQHLGGDLGVFLGHPPAAPDRFQLRAMIGICGGHGRSSALRSGA
jgi:hypothetical protein